MVIWWQYATRNSRMFVSVPCLYYIISLLCSRLPNARPVIRDLIIWICLANFLVFYFGFSFHLFKINTKIRISINILVSIVDWNLPWVNFNALMKCYNITYILLFQIYLLLSFTWAPSIQLSSYFIINNVMLFDLVLNFTTWTMSQILEPSILIWLLL